MWIYKITNIQNNKIYIGQTIRPVQDRFNRHINDALHNIIDTRFARAIRKYGKDNFSLEIIDTAQSQNKLNDKERYWIQYYNSVKEGYNETDALSECGVTPINLKLKKKWKLLKKKFDKLKLEQKILWLVKLKGRTLKLIK